MKGVIMKALSLVALLISANVTAACWDNEKKSERINLCPLFQNVMTAKLKTIFGTSTKRSPKSKEKDY